MMGTWLWKFDLDDKVWVKYGKDKYQAAYVSFIKLNSRRDRSRTEIGFRTFFDAIELPSVDYYDDTNQFFMSDKPRELFIEGNHSIEVTIRKAAPGDFDLI